MTTISAGRLWLAWYYRVIAERSIRQGPELYADWVEVIAFCKLFTIHTTQEWFFQRVEARGIALPCRPFGTAGWNLVVAEESRGLPVLGKCHCL
ncbi:Protein of unknown function [Pyronema omphalodes CBS 100304]|uniref:Uncharacterized protein n=1 Tax=Pyronema omphalodes (strain CBS 100304) TaxID=1076935 RepID=U4LJX7_PYROM|nr:Protein of unknown function [Pyronema omphalodes CBS 100304]